MVQIAERASILDQGADKILLIERAHRLWDKQAAFEWALGDVSSCNSSIVSDNDSIDEEGNGSGFNSPSWEGIPASDPTKPDPSSTLQWPPYAQELSAYEPDPLLNPSSTTCQLCDRPLNAESETLCDSSGRYSLAYATGKLQHAQVSLNIPVPSIYSVSEADMQLDISQRTAKGSLYSPSDDTSYQNMQHSSCLSCGVTVMWPEASFCLTCVENYDSREKLFDASRTTSSAGDHIEPTSRVAVPKNPGPLIYREEMSDFPLVRADKTTEDSKGHLITRVCPLYCDLPPPEFLLPRSHHRYGGDKANITGTCARKGRNPLV